MTVTPESRFGALISTSTAMPARVGISQLRGRGWTPELITKHLGPPDLKIGRGLWYVDKVVEVEKTQDFIADYQPKTTMSREEFFAFTSRLEDERARSRCP